MSKKKSKKSDFPPESSAEGENGKHLDAPPKSVANGADRIGQHPHPAANGNGHDCGDSDFDESMDMLPDHIRKQLEAIRKRATEAQDLSREARDNYETARKTLEQLQKDSEGRMRELEEKAQKQADEYREQNLRLRAEAENIRKRAAEQSENIRKYAVEAFANGVCEICDCLEAAMVSNPEDPQALREGVQLTLRKLASIMDAHGIQPVNPDIGANFDPAIHQAVAKSADASQPKNTVAVVIRKGYTIHERMLRPADVIVSISSASPDSSESAPKSGGKKSKGGKSA